MLPRSFRAIFRHAISMFFEIAFEMLSRYFSTFLPTCYRDVSRSFLRDAMEALFENSFDMSSGHFRHALEILFELSFDIFSTSFWTCCRDFFRASFRYPIVMLSENLRHIIGMFFEISFDIFSSFFDVPSRCFRHLFSHAIEMFSTCLPRCSRGILRD